MAKNPFGPKGFTAADIPSLSGRTYAITGGNSGIGLEAARFLGGAGARVIILCRSDDKARAALEDLRKTTPQGIYDSAPLDLARLSSVRHCADALHQKTDKLDGMINNAGLMFIPRRTVTEDGFEMHFGVNVLGHFALSAAVSDLVEAARGRFVHVASLAHHFAKDGLPLEDLTLSKGYSPMKAYAVSKLGNLIFAIELQRRLAAAGSRATSYGCHPGYSATNLQSTAPGAVATLIMKPLNFLFAQSAEKGALPTVLAAASDKAVPGGYYGPTGPREFKGPVGNAEIKPWASNPEAGRGFWDKATELTKARWPVLS